MLLVVVVAKLWIDSAKHELILLYGGNCSPPYKNFRGDKNEIFNNYNYSNMFTYIVLRKFKKI